MVGCKIHGQLKVSDQTPSGMITKIQLVFCWAYKTLVIIQPERRKVKKGDGVKNEVQEKITAFF